MAALPHAFGGVGVEDGLDLIERGLVDQGLVGAVVFDTAPGDVTDVVAVAQHVVQLVGAYRALGLFGGWPVGQASAFQGVGEFSKTPLTGGVGGEGPADVVLGLEVSLDGSDFAAVDELADVAVADRGATDGAAAAYFLAESFGDLLARLRE